MDCIFCKIVTGDIPSYRVYEDEHYLGFLNIRPLTPGNVILIPKKHYRWVYDVQEMGKYFEVAKKIGNHIRTVLHAESINFLTIGEEVPHAHIWIIPRYKNDGKVIEVHECPALPDSKMKEIAGLLFHSLS